MSYILRPYPDVIKAAIGRIVKDERIKANAKRVNESRIEMQELEKILEEIEQKQVILKKPNWCPIKPLPERANHENYCDNGRYDKGWNDCLDEIEERN